MCSRISWIFASILVFSFSAISQEPSPPGCHRFHTELSPEQKAHILDGEFVVLTKVELLPEEVDSALAVVFQQERFEMANPGQKYQVSDFGRDGPLRRLVFAGISSDKCFVHYERGGRGHGYYAVVFRIDAQKKAKFLWAGAGSSRYPALDLQQLRTEISEGQFKDRELYSW
jgi:hypothetical protein